MPLGAPEIILIILGLLILFGGRKIPELMRGLGSGIKEFKKATTLDEPAEQRNETKQHIEPKQTQETQSSAS